MILMAGARTVAEVLETMVSSKQWRYRFVQLVFRQRESNWIRLYPVLDEPDPYFDFVYTSLQEPTDLIAHLEREFGPCGLVDWSPGRLACIRAKGSDRKRLAHMVDYVAKATFGEDAGEMTAYYEQQRPA